MEKRITELLGRQRDQNQQNKSSAYEKRSVNLEERRKDHTRFQGLNSDNVISSSNTNPTSASEQGQRRDHDHPQPEMQRALETIRKFLKIRVVGKFRLIVSLRLSGVPKQYDLCRLLFCLVALSQDQPIVYHYQNTIER
jgi:hypothetical protein